MTKRMKKSFGLLEVVIAVALFTVFAASIITVISLSSRNLVVGKHRLQAANLAREGLEIVAEIRDTAWSVGDDWAKIGDNGYGGPTQPADGPCWGLTAGTGNRKLNFDVSSYGSSWTASCTFGHWRLVDLAYNMGGTNYRQITQNNVQFTREFIVTDISGDRKEITVIVTWNDYGQQKNVQMKIQLTNWK